MGIGTTGPHYQQEIYGTGQHGATITDAGATGGSLFINTPTVNAGDGGALILGAGGTGGKPFAAVKGYLTDGSTNTVGDLAFYTRNATADTALTERMRILSTGNVGIGTSTPKATLHIQGGNTNDLIVDNDGSQYTELDYNNNGVGKFATYWDNSNSFFTLGTTEYIKSKVIGINTSTPAASLTVQGTGTSDIFSVASSSAVSQFTVDRWGHMVTGGESPTCGTGCASVKGDDHTFRAVTGAGVTSVTINFAHAYANTPVCVAADESGGTTVSDASSTPSTVVLNLSASLNAKNIAVICQGSNNISP